MRLWPPRLCLVVAVHWGFYSNTLKPSLTIAPGTTVTVEMLTHHAGECWPWRGLVPSHADCC